ncbi:bifunctional phosphoribosyl-AMP cyclohydrolase/phosphoribosyl-ATP diphosphatase HisIE [Patulibacter brassicae]|uniref:Histidine biosynthesis bifunctional protein HisIE n=1 Tax=Patulibacter brassicae TaxID=1705717 RepID=A0ABU4VGQ9_9ACTN|nr:bifunctional phosphoribosyl-AMP cyclohydrolase/phosphoribosyl-ATP diphosphatase HisIE [Patulibacter brassicae]MDX8150615.1 bifunctional phosphoribosyl-AMP cyclohydrolase/phosphoribosyl-ATP diphosphatase HisIE [Patulibacter brassicae]
MPDLPDLTATVRFDEAGLVPVVIQDAGSGEVLTLAYANALALQRTRETGELHLWSRSRGELWHKGATSGNVQRVVDLRVDCDADAVLAIVEPAGPACHTGARTCFGAHDRPRVADGSLGPAELPAARLADFEVLPDLERVLAARAVDAPEGSYTAQLLGDRAFAGAKVQEEAEEVHRAAREESDERVDNEAADVLYHLLALIRGRGRDLGDVAAVLRERRR